jgi:replication factor A1
LDKIDKLVNRQRKVSIVVRVDEKGEPRQVNSRYKDETYTVADAIVSDETGSIKLILWNEQIDQVEVGNTLRIENGYVSEWRGELQLNIGKYGTMSVE